MSCVKRTKFFVSIVMLKPVTSKFWQIYEKSALHWNCRFLCASLSLCVYEAQSDVSANIVPEDCWPPCRHMNLCCVVRVLTLSHWQNFYLRRPNVFARFAESHHARLPSARVRRTQAPLRSFRPETRSPQQFQAGPSRDSHEQTIRRWKHLPTYRHFLTICTVSLFRSSFSCPNETWTITSRSREILTYSGTFVPFAGAHVIRPCVRQFANLTLMSDLFYYQGTHLSPSIGISFLSR